MNSPAHPIRVALMCENPAVYRSLSSRLAADPAFEVAEATDCQVDNVATVMARDPQVVILGVSRITHFNMLVCEAIRQANPRKPIVVLPSYEIDPAEEQRARASGVSVIILKSIDTPALVDQIRALVKQLGS
jgi:DNA-binding NarL/FixJ family response regulator